MKRLSSFDKHLLCKDITNKKKYPIFLIFFSYLILVEIKEVKCAFRASEST